MITLVLYVALQGQYYPAALPIKIHQFKEAKSCAEVGVDIAKQNPDIVIRAICEDAEGKVVFDSSLQ